MKCRAPTGTLRMPEASGSGVELADVEGSVDGAGETEVDGVGATEGDGEGGGSVGLGAGDGATVGDPVGDGDPLAAAGIAIATPAVRKTARMPTSRRDRRSRTARPTWVDGSDGSRDRR
jgi:hypothetical protein